MNKIKFIKEVGDTNYIEVEGVTYGIQDISKRSTSAIEDTKLLTKEEKLKEFRKIIPSYEAFKNLIKEENGFVKIEGIFDVTMLDLFKDMDACFYVDRIAIEPKYRNAGIGNIIYSYVERIVKEIGYKCIFVAVVGTWQIIKFYKRQGFFPIDELDNRYIIPLLEELNDDNMAIVDLKGDRYLMPMQKFVR